VAVAVFLIGSAAVLAVSLVFLAVGQSEDRERAQPEPHAAQERPPPGEDAGGLARSRRRPLPPRRPR
jgi:hypothetical protein